MKDICNDNKVTMKETSVTVSDGVELIIFEFLPESCDENSPVLLFVAGWVSLIKGWHDVLKVVVPDFRVLYVETREKKSAVLPKGEYPSFTVARMSMDIDEVVRAKVDENTPFYLAGSSLGSTVALDYLSHPDYRQPEKSMLISPIGEVNFPFWAKIIINYFPPSAYVVIKHLVIWYLNTFRVDKKKEPEQAEKYRGTVSSAEPKRLQANARTLYDYSVWDKIPLIPSPVVIVGAETDKLHGLETLERMVGLIPEAKLEIMESNKATHSGKAGRLIAGYMSDTK